MQRQEELDEESDEEELEELLEESEEIVYVEYLNEKKNT